MEKSKTASLQRTADDLRYKLIRQGFVLQGLTFRDLAKRLKVTPGAITHVAKGRRVSRRIRRALAVSLGTSYKQLWEK